MAVSKKAFDILRKSRCADISDALDSMGLQDMYSMDPGMRPLIPRTGFCGFACTMEFTKTDEKMPYMEYEDFERLQYALKRDGGYLFADNLKDPGLVAKVFELLGAAEPDRVIVCACNGLIGGVFGSENSMGLVNNGVVGIVIDGYMRDTDECIIEKIPVFSKGISYVHPQGRLQAVSVNKTVVCGGVPVAPGDVIRADNDGIIVIPAKYADEVAYRAYRIQQADRIGRRRNYEKAGKPYDETVELLPDIERWF